MIRKCTFMQRYLSPRKKDLEQNKAYLTKFSTEKMDG